MTGISLIDRSQCPVCGGHAHVIHMPFAEIPVVKCTDCEFIWSSKVLAEQELRAYYENCFGSQRHRRGQIINAKVNSWVIKKLMNIRDVKTVLDVGTGYGFFLKELQRQFNIDVTGVELSHLEATYAKSTLGLNVVNLPLSESGRKH